jgi:hypothetical protein
MPRRKNRSSKSRGHRRISTGITTVSGCDVFALTYTGSFAFNQHNAQATAYDRASYFASIFEEYRPISLSFETLPSSGAIVALGWQGGGDQPATPSGITAVQVMNLRPSKLWYPGQTAPVRLHVRGNNLGMLYPWLSCNNNRGVIGHLYAASTATSIGATVLVKVNYTFQFRGPVYYAYEVDKIPLGRLHMRDEQYTDEKSDPSIQTLVEEPVCRQQDVPMAATATHDRTLPTHLGEDETAEDETDSQSVTELISTSVRTQTEVPIVRHGQYRALNVRAPHASLPTGPRDPARAFRSAAPAMNTKPPRGNQ